MVKKVQKPLSPTLWRTCRALANKKRLHLLQYVMHQKGVNVTTAAFDLDLTTSAASEYLRALNARGLLQAKRHGRHVRYEAAHDPSLPGTELLLNALRISLGKKKGAIDSAFRSLTAFTHPLRITLFRAVAAGAGDLSTIRAGTGISSAAAVRHLKKLLRRGCIGRVNDRYRLRRPLDPLARALTGLALQ